MLTLILKELIRFDKNEGQMGNIKIYIDRQGESKSKRLRDRTLYVVEQGDFLS